MTEAHEDPAFRGLRLDVTLSRDSVVLLDDRCEELVVVQYDRSSKRTRKRAERIAALLDACYGIPTDLLKNYDLAGVLKDWLREGHYQTDAELASITRIETCADRGEVYPKTREQIEDEYGEANEIARGVRLDAEADERAADDLAADEPGGAA